MGLTIINNVVLIDKNSKEHLVTTRKGNPKKFTIDNEYGTIDVVSIFTRLKASSKNRRDRKSRLIGDNCPLIYALKEKDGLTTTIATIKEIILVGREIAGDLELDSDFSLVCTPSAHNIVKQVAKIVGQTFKLPVYDDLLDKTSTELATQDLQKAISKAKNFSDKKEIQNQIEKIKGRDSFSLKDVAPSCRHHIFPVVLNKKIKLGKIILVDDLVSTGTTLIAAKNLLTSSACATDVVALSLFSNT